jgi:hypothetical protein
MTHQFVAGAMLEAAGVPGRFGSALACAPAGKLDTACEVKLGCTDVIAAALPHAWLQKFS